MPKTTDGSNRTWRLRSLLCVVLIFALGGMVLALLLHRDGSDGASPERREPAKPTPAARPTPQESAQAARPAPPQDRDEETLSPRQGARSDGPVNWFVVVPSALAVALATVLLAGLVKRLVRRQEARVQRITRDEEKTRRIHTQFVMIRRIFIPLIYFIGTIVVLMQFPALRRLGTTFLASAGVAGIVVGMAARSTLANAVAGIMLCFSRPVRVGDTVAIGNEYGTIEEVGLMYTTFKTWDNRRVMIPNEVMADKEIINYSIRDQKIWAKVPIHLDYSADVEKARAILIEIIKNSESWNGQDEPVVWFMELGEQTLTLWAAAWADSPSGAWKLKCDILDNALVRFREEGIALPRRRYQYDGVRVTLEPGRGPDPEEA